MLAEIGPWEIGGLVLLAIVLFGAKKLPEIGKGLGKGLREFRDATKGLGDEASKDKPPAPPAKDESGTSGPAAGA